MTNEQRMRNLKMPDHPVDVVLDTDAYNEVDDQYAISYLLACGEKLRLQAFYAAPFLKPHLESVKMGMEESYREIKDLLKLAEREATVLRGSDRFLQDEKTPVISNAAQDLARRAMGYSPVEPLYVIAIGAITNVASAILLEPKVAENAVVIWLGGHGKRCALCAAALQWCGELLPHLRSGAGILARWEKPADRLSGCIHQKNGGELCSR